jgi:hypothetical protein
MWWSPGRARPLDPPAYGLGADVDAHAGEAGSEAGVLALLADGQAELVVGDDHLGLREVVVM